MKSDNFLLSLIFITSIIIIIFKLFNSFISLLISSLFLILIFLRRFINRKNILKEKLKEHNKHIEDLKISGIKKLNLQRRIYTRNIATSINIFQGDKIMVSFLGGKFIIYSIDIINYYFIELLHINEFFYNNSLQLQYDNNLILIHSNLGVQIFEIKITNLKGLRGNKYILKQKFNLDQFHNDIIKVIELDKNTLVGISIDYLLIWYKIKDEYILSEKYLDFNKYENLLFLINLLKLDNNNIVLLKQANSNMTRSTVDFIEITNNEPKEIKLLNVDISHSEPGSNNLLLINEKEKIFLVGCMKGIAVISGKYMELVQFISTGEQIKCLEIFFNKIIFFNYELENVKEYILYQIEFNNDFENEEKIILKNSLIKKPLNTIKFFKDGIVIIGAHERYLQLWH